MFFWQGLSTKRPTSAPSTSMRSYVGTKLLSDLCIKKVIAHQRRLSTKLYSRIAVDTNSLQIKKINDANICRLSTLMEFLRLLVIMNK